MPDLIKLQVLIATFDKKGLANVERMNLPVVEGVEYIVSCQNPYDGDISIPHSLIREDIRIFFLNSKGLSKNRNNLLDLASAPISLIADDDLRYTREGLLSVIEVFENNKDIEIATFSFIQANSTYEKKYPDYSFNLRSPAPGYYVTSFEIAFRTAPVKNSGVKFNENFGIGAPGYGCGEEELWIHSLLKKGLRGKFFPIVITTHCGSTTGLREAARPDVLRAQGAVIKVLYPLTSFIRIFLKAYRTSNSSGSSLFHCLKYLLTGWLKATFNPKFTT